MLNLESEGSVASLPFSTCARYVYYLGPKSVTDTVLSAVQRSRNISPPRCLTQVKWQCKALGQKERTHMTQMGRDK